MHLLLGRTRGRSVHRRICKVRLEPPRPRKIATMRRNVLNEGAAGRRRRDDRADLQGTCCQTRLRIWRMGLEDSLSRDGCNLILGSGSGSLQVRAALQGGMQGYGGLSWGVD